MKNQGHKALKSTSDKRHYRGQRFPEPPLGEWGYEVRAVEGRFARVLKGCQDLVITGTIGPRMVPLAVTLRPFGFLEEHPAQP